MTQTETIIGPALEEALAALCDKHDLTRLSVAYRKGFSKEYAFDATCHWNGFSRRNITCASGYGSDINAAVSSAIIAMQKDRTPDDSAVTVLPASEVAS